jgi:hypothetical protein
MVSVAAQQLALAASGWAADPARKRNPAEVLKIAKKRGDYLLFTARIVERRFVYHELQVARCLNQGSCRTSG